MEFINERAYDRQKHLMMPETDRETWLEIGCGNGHFLQTMLIREPEIAWVALDNKKKRINKTRSKLERLGNPRVTLIYGDFFSLAPAWLPRGYFARIFVNFPDPWPKSRHQKYRVVASRTLPWLHELNAENGILSIATDDSRYAEEVLCASSEFPDYENIYPPYRSERTELPSTLYHERWQGECRDLFFFDFRKNQRRE